MRQALSRLGYTDKRCVFHSLRHGAATQASLDGEDTQQIMYYGRWESDKNARHYNQAGQLMSMVVRPPPLVADLEQQLARRGRREERAGGRYDPVGDVLKWVTEKVTGHRDW